MVETVQTCLFLVLVAIGIALIICHVWYQFHVRESKRQLDASWNNLFSVLAQLRKSRGSEPSGDCN